MFCTEIINVSKQTIDVFPRRYSIPIQYGGPYSDVTTKFPQRSNLLVRLIRETLYLIESLMAYS